MFFNAVLFIVGLGVTLLVRTYLWSMVSYGIMSAVDGVFYQLIVIGSLENFNLKGKYIDKIENFIYIFNALGVYLVAIASVFYTSTDSLLIFFLILGAISCIPILIVFKESVYYSMMNGDTSRALHDLRNMQLTNHPEIPNTVTTRKNFLIGLNYPAEKVNSLYRKYYREIEKNGSPDRVPNTLNPLRKNLQIKVTGRGRNDSISNTE
jgi:hypothetical protein